ncbi:MAG TPA: thioredoxin [Candidatus Paceibacterota bacterium]|nr:thioredoxin [Candidatus Paceibacterota bacterium]
MVISLTKNLFEEKISFLSEEFKFKGNKPAIIDWYASWCNPCKIVAPILEDLSQEYEDKIDIYKIDVDQEQELAMAFGIQSVPSMLFIPLNGEPQMAQGALPKQTFKRIFSEVFNI